MLRTLTFEPYAPLDLTTGGETPPGVLHFQFLHDAVFLAGTGAGQSQRSTEDRRRSAKLQRALKTISEPDPERKDLGPAFDNPRRLRPAGGTLTIEQAEHDYLVRVLEGVNWLPRLDIAFADTLDWLQAADKTKD